MQDIKDIKEHLERIDIKRNDLKGLIFEYTNTIYVEYTSIQVSIIRYNNMLLYYSNNNNQILDSDIVQLIDLEKRLDRLIIEIKEKNLIEKVRNLLDSSIESINYHIRKKQEPIGLHALKSDLQNILRIIDSRLERE